MLHAFKLFTGDDNQSHVVEGSVSEDIHSDVVSIHFKETAAHSTLDWHVAPTKQYVITLSGTLEFTTRGNEKFILKPGDVLVAEDDIGTGHCWKLIDDQPWRRAYIVLRDGAEDVFVAKV
tara:strand:- start:3978 stop:4337 length:360 start_codon:yes stop_codon:yes gene_type:complete